MHRKLNPIVLLVLSFYILILCGSALAEKVRIVTNPVNNPSIKKDAEQPPLLDVSALTEYRAEKGLRNLEPHSIVLVDKGVRALQKNKKSEAITYFKNAKELSPDLPQPYLYLAKAHFSFSLDGFTKASGYLLKACKALLNNFWWSFRITGTILTSLYLALYVSVITSFIVLISSKFSLYMHDVVEDRKKMLLLIPSIILLFFGPVLGLFAFILPFWAYQQEKERKLLYGLFSITSVVILTVPYLSSLVSAPGDIALRNVVNINSGLYTGDTSYAIRDGDNSMAAFSYALDLKRKGNYKEALKVYKGLLDKKADAKIYNNIANCYVGLNDYDTALSYYNEALQSEKMASTYYNLSQLQRELFNFTEAKKYYNEALRISPEKVASYTTIRGTSVNRFVMDEVLGNKELWLLAFKQTYKGGSSMRLEEMLYFTNRWVAVFIVLLIIIAISVYNRRISVHAYKCQRCGKIQCSRCEKKKLSHDGVCLTCHKTFVQISLLNPVGRIEKIIEIHHYRDNKNFRLKIMTLLLPGSGHIYYGWPILGFSILLLFTFLLFSALMWTYSTLPVAMAQTADIFKWISVTGLVYIYIVTLVNVFKRVREWR